jgi:hypothetical protein
LPIAGTAIAVGVCVGDAAAVVGRAFRSRGSGPACDRAGWFILYPSFHLRRISLRSTFILLVLGASIAATLWIQARDYLLVAPEELTIRYKGGRQWVALRAIGRELSRRATIWQHPHLYVWGWQSPLHFYSRLDSPTRHFFVDNLLRDQADRGHPLIQPRTEEIMAALRARPPELIFTGYAPFRALRRFLDERYLPSRLAPGLWVRREDYGRFEGSIKH